MDVAAARPAGVWLEFSASASSTYRRVLFWIAALSLAYYATAVAGYASLMIPSLPSMAVLWPPNVLLFVAFLLTPARLWPLVILFAFLTQLAVAATMSIPLGRSLGMFTGNVSQPIIAATILSRLGHRGTAPEHPQRCDGVRARRRHRRAGHRVGHLDGDVHCERLGRRFLATLADAVRHQRSLDDCARAAAADVPRLALRAPSNRTARRRVPRPADGPDGKRAARQHPRHAGDHFPAALRAAAVPLVGGRALRAGGTRHRAVFHDALSLLRRRPPGAGPRHVRRTRSSRPSSPSSRCRCRSSSCQRS